MDEQTNVQDDTPVIEPEGKDEHSYLFKIDTLNSECEAILHFKQEDSKEEAKYERKLFEPEEYQGKYVFFEPSTKDLVDAYDEPPTKSHLRDRLKSIARARQKKEEQLTDLQQEVADKLEALAQQSVQYKKLREQAVTNAKRDFYHRKLVNNNQKFAKLFEGLANPEDVSLEDDIEEANSEQDEQ